MDVCFLKCILCGLDAETYIGTIPLDISPKEKLILCDVCEIKAMSNQEQIICSSDLENKKYLRFPEKVLKQIFKETYKYKLILVCTPAVFKKYEYLYDKLIYVNTNT